MTKGMIFDIQRYSIHDGPGIRTTVFLKECPLRCGWCANPESWGSVPRLFHLQSRCIRCFSCAAAAKEGQVKAAPDGPIFDFGSCTGDDALRLAAACPAGALVVKGTPMTPEEVFRAIERDLPFYERSGGGVTLSGGEPLLQKDFAKELLTLCKKARISTAVETTGLVPWETFAELQGLVDLYLYDIKHLDPEVHKARTGRSNEQISENLKKLSATGAHIHVRTPVIPGFNDTPEALRAIADFLDALGIRERTLLPFHQYGSSKFRSCGLSYQMDGVPQMTPETLQHLAETSKFYQTGGNKS